MMRFGKARVQLCVGAQLNARIHMHLRLSKCLNPCTVMLRMKRVFILCSIILTTIRSTPYLLCRHFGAKLHVNAKVRRVALP